MQLRWSAVQQKDSCWKSRAAAAVLLYCCTAVLLYLLKEGLLLLLLYFYFKLGANWALLSNTNCQSTRNIWKIAQIVHRCPHTFFVQSELQHTRHLSFSLGPIDCQHSRHIDFDLTSNPPPAANERMFLMPMTLDGDYPRFNINIIISIAVSMTCEVNPRWYFQRTLRDQPSKGKLASFSFSLS